MALSLSDRKRETFTYPCSEGAAFGSRTYPTDEIVFVLCVIITRTLAMMSRAR